VNRRGKTIALSTVAMGMVVLVAAGIAARPRIVEAWHIRGLGSDDEKVREAAAMGLGGCRSPHGLLALVRIAADDPVARVREAAEVAIFDSAAAGIPQDIAKTMEMFLKESAPEGGADLLRFYKVVGRSFQKVLKDFGVANYPSEVHSFDDFVLLMRLFAEATASATPALPDTGTATKGTQQRF